MRPAAGAERNLEIAADALRLPEWDASSARSPVARSARGAVPPAALCT